MEYFLHIYKNLILFLRKKDFGKGAKYLLAYVRVQIWGEASLEVVPCSSDGTGFLGNTITSLSTALFLSQLIHRNK